MLSAALEGLSRRTCFSVSKLSCFFFFYLNVVTNVCAMETLIASQIVLFILHTFADMRYINAPGSMQSACLFVDLIFSSVPYLVTTFVLVVTSFAVKPA